MGDFPEDVRLRLKLLEMVLEKSIVSPIQTDAQLVERVVAIERWVTGADKSEEVSDIAVIDLGLPKKIANKLVSFRIFTVGCLAKLTALDLAQIGFDNDSLTEIFSALDKKNISMPAKTYVEKYKEEQIRQLMSDRRKKR